MARRALFIDSDEEVPTDEKLEHYSASCPPELLPESHAILKRQKSLDANMVRRTSILSSGVKPEHILPPPAPSLGTNSANFERRPSREEKRKSAGPEDPPFAACAIQGIPLKKEEASLKKEGKREFKTEVKREKEAKEVKKEDAKGPFSVKKEPLSGGKKKKPKLPPVFAGLKIFMIEKGIGKVQLGVLKSHIIEQGGGLQPEVTTETTHILTNLSLPRALEALKLKSLSKFPKARLYSVEWVSESLRKGEKAQEDQFLVVGQPPLHVSASLPMESAALKRERSFSVDNAKTKPYSSQTSQGPSVDWSKEVVVTSDSDDDGQQEYSSTPTKKSRFSESSDRSGSLSPKKPYHLPMPPSPQWLKLSPASNASPARETKVEELEGEAAEGEAVAALFAPHRLLQTQQDKEKSSISSSLEPPQLSEETSPTLSPNKPAAVSLTLQRPVKVEIEPVVNYKVSPDSNPFFAFLFPTVPPANAEGEEAPLSPHREESITGDVDILARMERNENDSEEEEKNQKRQPKLKQWMLKKKQLFACQKPSDAPQKINHNKHITDILEKLEETNRTMGDQWRAYAYRKSISVLKACPRKITSIDEARKLRGIGESIADKIGEILDTGHLRKAENTDEMTKVCNVFMKIWGAGPETVKKWYAKGHRTLKDLEMSTDLNHQQRVGLKYYHDLQKRIPREEVTAVEKVVKDALQSIDPHLIAVTCGSYRRGKPDCGDIDILITNKSGSSLDGTLVELVKRLHQSGFIKDDLTHKSEDKYFGIGALPGCPGRRIDFQLIAVEEWPFALLYFTGSDHFNRSMRFWAKKNGYSLSEHSLVPRLSDDMKGAPLPGLNTEEDIFKALGLKCTSLLSSFHSLLSLVTQLPDIPPEQRSV